MRLWKSAVVALALSSLAGESAVAAPKVREIRCGALRGTAVYGIAAQGTRCAEARRVASLHERAVRRRGRGACVVDGPSCRVGAFTCVARVGRRPRPQDAIATCGDRRNTRQVTFRYDARKIRLPPPPRDDPPAQTPEEPPATPAP